MTREEADPAAASDISERKRAEEALRESEECYRLLLESISDGIAVIDHEWRYVMVNESMARVLQMSKSDLVGAKVADRFPDFEQTRFFETYQQVMETSRPATIVDEYTLPDGRKMWLEVHAYPAPRGVLRIAIDISERKRAEEALRESEERFRRLSESAFEGVVIHDKGRILDGNQAFVTMFGYELPEAIGMHATEFVAPESRDLIAQRVQSGYREPFEALGMRKDGSTFPGVFRAKPIPYQGRMVSVAVMREITDLKQAEEALQKAREELENRVERQMERGNPYGLTFRELTVLHLVAAGRADKEIGFELGISVQTAQKHVANILHKMGTASRTEASVRAVREGLLD